MDVVCFDRDRFVKDLNKPDVEDVLI